MKLPPFERTLREEDFAENTVETYSYAVQDFLTRYKKPSRESLSAYKAFLVKTYKPTTVNVRILSLNKYMEALGHDELKMKTIKMPKESFLDHIISNEDYLSFKELLRKEPDLRWHFIVWFLAATGARISELVRFTVEDVHAGYVDIYSKGGRMRRLYFPEKLRKEALKWHEKEGRSSGFLFLNTKGGRLTPRGISIRLKEFASKYGIDPDQVHPHAFRHLFAKNFLQKNNDIALLADLLGHSSIETTRIYLQQSSREQGKMVDEIVDW